MCKLGTQYFEKSVFVKNKNEIKKINCKDVSHVKYLRKLIIGQLNISSLQNEFD